jgi:hypothetical protein
VAWGERASVDDLLAMNSDYRQLLALQAALQWPAGLVASERQLELLGLDSGNPSSLPDVVRDMLDRRGPFDQQAMLLDRLPFPINLFETLEGLVFSKHAGTHADPRLTLSSPLNRKTTDESAQLKLIHKPEKRQQPLPMPPPPQRRPALPR